MLKNIRKEKAYTERLKYSDNIIAIIYNMFVKIGAKPIGLK